ncbi:MAG: hypothetical protein LBJ12_08770 [Oscillospiraceae bacterium]|jgi:phage-related protein|nr:hypothetical protein [Oscillospiraceae bacterium]
MDKIIEVLNAVAAWFIADAHPKGALTDSLGEFVKTLLNTIINVIFPV